MLKKLKEHREELLTGAIIALTVTVVVVTRRTNVVTDVLLTDEGGFVVEYSNGSSNAYSMK